MNRKQLLKYFTLCLLAVGMSNAGVAQVTDIGAIVRDYVPGREKPVPVSLSGISGEAAAVIQFDLTVQGFSFTGRRARNTSSAGAPTAT